MQFRVNDYLALLVTLLIRRVLHLNQLAYSRPHTVNMLVCLHSWISDEI